MFNKIIPSTPGNSKPVTKGAKPPNDNQSPPRHGGGEKGRRAPASPPSPPQRREEILSAYQERSSLRGLARTFGVSRNTVTRWLKKAARLPPLSPTLPPAPPSGEDLVLEVDELWSFVGMKADKRWVRGSPWRATLVRW